MADKPDPLAVERAEKLLHTLAIDLASEEPTPVEGRCPVADAPRYFA
jgi:hypothetical protein